MASRSGRTWHSSIEELDEDVEEDILYCAALHQQAVNKTPQPAALRQHDRPTAKYVIKHQPKPAQNPEQPSAALLRQLLSTPSASKCFADQVEDSPSESEEHQPSTATPAAEQVTEIPASAQQLSCLSHSDAVRSRFGQADVGTATPLPNSLTGGPTGVFRMMIEAPQAGTPMSAQRQFLASHVSLAGSSTKPSSAKLPTPQKGDAALRAQRFVRSPVKTSIDGSSVIM